MAEHELQRDTKLVWCDRCERAWPADFPFIPTECERPSLSDQSYAAEKAGTAWPIPR